MVKVRWVLAALLVTAMVPACRLLVGDECVTRGQGAGVGGGGTPFPPGAGGYGEDVGEDAEPIECSDEDAAHGMHRCKVPGSEECVNRCEAIRASCPHYATYPRDPSKGDGALYMCQNFGPNRWECAFKYSNGEYCRREYPRGNWFCYR